MNRWVRLATLTPACILWTVYLIGARGTQLPSAPPALEIAVAAQQSDSATPIAEAVVENEQIIDPPQSPSPLAAVAPEKCVNVNQGAVADLVTLPGIGPVIAERIMAWRQGGATFAKPEDLMDIKGIGPAKMEKIRNLICF